MLKELYNKFYEIKKNYNFSDETINIYIKSAIELSNCNHESAEVEFMVSYLDIKMNLCNNIRINIAIHIVYDNNVMLFYTLIDNDNIVEYSLSSITDIKNLINKITKIPFRKKKMAQLL